MPFYSIIYKSAKIILVFPKCEIIMLLINYFFSTFLYCSLYSYWCSSFLLDFWYQFFASSFVCYFIVIAPSINSIAIDIAFSLSCCFSYNFPFFIWFIPLVYIIRIKPAPGDHKSNFKKVDAILRGCKTTLTPLIKWYIFLT